LQLRRGKDGKTAVAEQGKNTSHCSDGKKEIQRVAHEKGLVKEKAGDAKRTTVGGKDMFCANRGVREKDERCRGDEPLPGSNGFGDRGKGNVNPWRWRESRRGGLGRNSKENVQHIVRKEKEKSFTSSGPEKKHPHVMVRETVRSGKQGDKRKERTKSSKKGPPIIRGSSVSQREEVREIKGIVERSLGRGGEKRDEKTKPKGKMKGKNTTSHRLAGGTFTQHLRRRSTKFLTIAKRGEPKL